MKVVNIHQLLCTVDSKIHKNCCKQNIQTKSGNGYFIKVYIIYFCIIYTIIYLIYDNSILLLSCFFESSVSIHMHI